MLTHWFRYLPVSLFAMIRSCEMPSTDSYAGDSCPKVSLRFGAFRSSQRLILSD